ncbi:MAG: hypothetical protein ACYDA0_11735 [Candidatus Dormibacteraceae bacterium]
MAVAAAALVTLAACELPFGLGLPTIRALNSGARDSLDAARSFRIAGSYTESTLWKMDLEIVRPRTEHVMLSGKNFDLEAIITEHGTYFRGQQFLSSQMGSDPNSRSLVRAAGDGWWTGLSSIAPDLPDFTKGSGLASTFLGTAVTSRTDHVSAGGLPAIELSGPRADVFLGEAPPYRVLRIRMKNGAVVDGISNADLLYGDFNRDFAIVEPTGAVNFSDLSTLPPVYTVVSVDTSGCASPCVVVASLKNLGGRTGARAPSTVTFTMTDPQTNAVIGACMVTVQPDIVHSATTTVSCTISGVSGGDHNAAVITAAADNPGRA